MKSMGAGAATGAGTGSAGAAGAQGAGDDGSRTTPLLRAGNAATGTADTGTGKPVTTRTDTGDFGSSSVNKTTRQTQLQHLTIIITC